jgi:hypothetical protein
LAIAAAPLAVASPRCTTTRSVSRHRANTCSQLADRTHVAHGQRLVAQYRLPPETIARYAAMAAGTASKERSRDDSMFADHSPWVGPEQRAGVGNNPYVLVFTVSGVARAAGEVYAHWQAGWDIHESPIASRELLMKVAPITRTGLAAGQALTLSASSARVSFRGERSVAPMLGLVQMRNLDINDVQVQVWSGAAPPVAWASIPRSSSALLALAATCLLVGLGARYCRPAEREPVLQGGRMREQHCALATIECSPAADEHDAPAEPAPSHESRVIAALHQVLTVGLTVPTVLDEARMQRRRAAGRA